MPDRSARCLKKGGSPIDLHEKSGGAPDSDANPHPRKKKRIKEQRSKAKVRAPRRRMQVKILTRTMKDKGDSEHQSQWHKVSGSSSAKAHRIRAANLPSHRLSEIQRSEVVRSAGGKLSPIGCSCRKSLLRSTCVPVADSATGGCCQWNCRRADSEVPPPARGSGPEAKSEPRSDESPPPARASS